MKTDFTSPINKQAEHSRGNWFQDNMKSSRLLALAGVAAAALLLGGCAGVYVGDGYGYSDYSGGHHFFGNSFGHGGGSHGGFHGGGGGHGGHR